MRLYNLMNGVNAMSVFLIPMLGEKHPDDYPRFRDVFTSDEEHPQYDNHIHLYTRVGGNNRNQDYGETELIKHPNFVTTYDDDFDDTYGTYIFSIPEEWKNDYEKIKEGRFSETSKAYQDRVHKVFPKLKQMLDKTFATNKPS